MQKRIHVLYLSMFVALSAVFGIITWITTDYNKILNAQITSHLYSEKKEKSIPEAYEWFREKAERIEFVTDRLGKDKLFSAQYERDRQILSKEISEYNFNAVQTADRNSWNCDLLYQYSLVEQLTLASKK